MKIKSFLSLCLLATASTVAADEFIKINTDQIGMVLRVKDNGRLYQSYLGKRLANDNDLQHLPQGNEAYLTHGMEDLNRPSKYTTTMPTRRCCSSTCRTSKRTYSRVWTRRSSRCKTTSIPSQ